MTEPATEPTKPAAPARKRWLMIFLRLAVAAAGIGYILSSLTWSDHVEIEAGMRLPGGVEVESDTSYKVIEGTVDVTGPPRELIIEVIDAKGQAFKYVVTENDQLTKRMRAIPGIKSMLGHARVDLLLWGLLLIGLIYPIQTVRWGLLLRARGLKTTVAKRFQLIMVGAFFNFCMPGTTGGDVAKAYYAAKRSDRRADAVVSVIFDRIAGLVALLFLAAFAGLFMLEDEVARRVTIGLWLGLVGLIALALIYFCIPLRNRIGVSWLLRKLPGQRYLLKIDDAAIAYRSHKSALVGAILITLPAHLATVTATALAGYALGMKVPFGLAATVLPVVFLAGSVPLTYQGLGVMEWLGRHLLVDPPHVYFNQIVGILLFFRLYQVAYSLLGSLFLLKGDIHLHPQLPADPADPTDPADSNETEDDDTAQDETDGGESAQDGQAAPGSTGP